MPKRIGLIVGREWSFPPAFVEEVRRRDAGVEAEFVKVGAPGMHHQGIKRLAEGLRPNAYAPDGLIEGVESPNGHFLLGVQWHPEALAERDPAMRKLFTAFVEEAAR